MNKLSSDFKLEKYGLKVRLVNEGDVPFILELRTNPKLSKYIHPTENNVEKQVAWIREYKVREKQGLDYYFIFYKDEHPVALSRIYDIHETWATGGSWLCVPGLMPDVSVATCIIGREILFDILQLEEDRFDVRKGNKQVLKMHEMFGATIVGESDIDYFFCLKKKDFEINSVKLMKLLDIH